MESGMTVEHTTVSSTIVASAALRAVIVDGQPAVELHPLGVLELVRAGTAGHGQRFTTADAHALADALHTSADIAEAALLSDGFE
ncbi:hypothetical protein CcI49_28485 [Frankia sp. CcI49]|uniref:hypothetical protein n=1 Tax=Frankia sp. CcI49 TaxID=1745382 RepID=UPI000978A75C|nr:hypothetical protein [Frankia sp. CcI49]ONH55463.1 hypothetical protein CcI49_28485 [Frankia sp. CcI49]